MATGDTLGDQERFPFFVRVRPANTDLARAAAKLLLHFGWSSIATISNDDAYAGNLATAVTRAVRLAQGQTLHQLSFVYEDATPNDALRAELAVKVKQMLALQPRPQVYFIETTFPAVALVAVEALRSGIEEAHPNSTNAMEGYALVGSHAFLQHREASLVRTTFNGALVVEVADDDDVLANNAVQVVAQALHKTINKKGNIANGEDLMKVIRGGVYNLGPKNVVEFDTESPSTGNNLDESRQSFAVFNARNGSWQNVGRIRRGDVSIDDVTSMVWLGNAAAIPQDRSPEYVPQQIVILALYENQTLCNYATRAAEEVNADPSLLPGIELVVHTHPNPTCQNIMWCDSLDEYENHTWTALAQAEKGTSASGGATTKEVVAAAITTSSAATSRMVGLLAARQIMVGASLADNSDLASTAQFPNLVRLDRLSDTQISKLTAKHRAFTRRSSVPIPNFARCTHNPWRPAYTCSVPHAP